MKHNEIDVDLPCKGRTPLFTAVEKGYETIAVAILNKSLKSINEGVKKDVFMLVNFAKKKNQTIANNVANLLDKATLNNFTPLHAAAFYGNKNLVELLIKNGADADAIATSGGKQIRPLDLAKAMGHEDIISTLKQNPLRTVIRRS